MKRPLNNNLVCKDLTENLIEGSTGFTIKKEERFKTLEVLYSSEVDVAVGDKVRVGIHSGEEDGDNIIIKRGDIIYIL
jgi:hypothetical protein